MCWFVVCLGTHQLAIRSAAASSVGGTESCLGEREVAHCVFMSVGVFAGTNAGGVVQFAGLVRAQQLSYSNVMFGILHALYCLHCTNDLSLVQCKQATVLVS